MLLAMLSAFRVLYQALFTQLRGSTKATFPEQRKPAPGSGVHYKHLSDTLLPKSVRWFLPTNEQLFDELFNKILEWVIKAASVAVIR